MAKKSYTEEVKELVSLLGGADNIVSYTHCISRLRLVLKDNSKADTKAIEALDNVKGVVKPVGAYHVVIGVDVTNYYKEFKNYLTNQQPQTNDSNSQTITVKQKSNQKFYQRLLRHFSEIFIPLIPALVAGGLILGFRNILETDWTGEGKSLVALSAFAKGLNEFLWIPAQAVFWYLPVAICWSIFKKMDGSPVLGIIIGLTLLLPPLENIYAISALAKDSIWIFKDAPAFDFGAFKFPWKLQYTAQVIPAIGVAFFGVYLEKGLNKIIPAILKQIFVPLLVIVLSYTVGLAIIGPIGFVIGSAISVASSWALTHPIAKYFFAPVFGLLYAPTVVTGLHTMYNAVMIQNTATIGGSFIFPILCMSNIAQGSASLMFTILNRKHQKVKDAGASATVSAYLAVTEPAMYGINLRFLYPFIAAIIGSATGALLLIISGVTSNGIGVGAWLGVLSIQATSKVNGVKTWIGSGYTWFMISAILTTVVTMILTWFLGTLPNFVKLRNDLLGVKTDPIIKIKK
ncbi:PTS transporter subunit EIIC [Mycoplasma mycoides subsp. capri]|uniref:PTS transporter subunit EIIC n=1 Tax=Mycoplasma mycoides TaxID=2102 RepID=UPI00223FB3CB|nr:PTS transporter subunit EIIC [Mycoplasma mycoides]QVJ96124.1 PTS transporter subunit EIIC [Mycoplasma mycoides subsp. capri]QVJ97018.1 PTS transporter subunit EIIC [Mycoplasma mycoides subsp. capri]QVJ99998.1 PTS transporter subunit EIIC [Mycoplasma mycoides subsp. capri]QVK00882.1 PTS transporter subunit EIIC [Mycoplasma mycoides subsp. capri]